MTFAGDPYPNGAQKPSIRARHASPRSAAAPARIVVLAPLGLLDGAVERLAIEPTLRPRLIGGVRIRLPDDRLLPTPPFAAGLPTLGEWCDWDDLDAALGPLIAVVCLPAAYTDVLAEIQRGLAETGTPCRLLPTVDDVVAGRSPAAAATAAKIDYARLLGRPTQTPDPQQLRSVLGGKRVLITGAGGSIGSELARLAASAGPADLVLMDRSDNALFQLDDELATLQPDSPRRLVLHDVVDAAQTLRWFSELRPEVVFHAAAHKHVPLMEDHPAPAVMNNVFGTASVVDACERAGVERCVLISTDKAVHPSSVMGATKRLAEHYARSRNDGASATRFAVVRFGNVLGSACSVLPIWSRQIARGGPVTVTDPRMTRYFMTIPEAAALVIRSASLVGAPGAHAPSADVFVFDMGEPVEILGLAERFIAEHGLSPIGPEAPRRRPDGRAMPIRITGVRPGEKLHEQLTYDAESLTPTAVAGVQAWAGARPTRAEADAMLAELAAVRDLPDAASVVRILSVLVPEMTRTAGDQSGATISIVRTTRIEAA